MPAQDAAGESLARVVMGDDGEGLRACARRLGVTPPALLKAERRIRGRLQLKG